MRSSTPSATAGQTPKEKEKTCTATINNSKGKTTSPSCPTKKRKIYNPNKTRTTHSLTEQAESKKAISKRGKSNSNKRPTRKREKSKKTLRTKIGPKYLTPSTSTMCTLLEAAKAKFS